MMMKLLFTSFYFVLLLLPTASWAINESGDVPLAQALTTPATAVPSQTSDNKAATTIPTSAPVAPAKQIPALVTPILPASAPVAPVMPAPVPVKPAPAPVKPAPAPVKPVPVPVKPVPVPVKPAPAPTTTQSPSSTADVIAHAADIEVFVREGCSSCEKALEFLDKLQSLQPQLKINIRDVRKEPAALELLKRMAQNQGNAALDYPAFVVSGHLFIGFTDEANTAQSILDNLPLSHSTSTQTDGVDECKNVTDPTCGLIPAPPPDKPENFTIDLWGYHIPLAKIGLPLFTIAMGLLDGLNHGSTWVLLLMISLLAPLKDRSRMLTIAGTFIAAQTILYFIVLTLWFNLFLLINFTRISQLVVGGVALIAAVIYFKNYLYFGQRLSLSSDEIAKPGIYTHIRKIVQADTLIASLLGTIALAIIVQVSEFSYTSVFPALYTEVLTMQKLSVLSNYSYLALYDLAYMLDDLIVLAIGITTLKPVQQQEKEGKGLKLISSLLILGTAAYLLLLIKY